MITPSAGRMHRTSVAMVQDPLRPSTALPAAQGTNLVVMTSWLLRLAVARDASSRPYAHELPLRRADAKLGVDLLDRDSLRGRRERCS